MSTPSSTDISSATGPIGLAVTLTVTSPRDPATGQATGKRTHKPFVSRPYY